VEEKFVKLFKRNKALSVRKILEKISKQHSHDNTIPTFYLFGPNEEKFDIKDRSNQKIGLLNVTDVEFAMNLRQKFKQSTIYFFYNGAFSLDHLKKIELVSEFCDVIVFKKKPTDIVDVNLNNKATQTELIDYEDYFLNFHGVHFLPLCVMYIFDGILCNLKVSGFDFFLSNEYRANYISYLNNANETRKSLVLHNPFIQYDFFCILHEMQAISFDEKVSEIMKSRRSYAMKLDLEYPREST
jgi:hypothetical protein